MEPIITIEISPSFSLGLTIILLREIGQTEAGITYSMKLDNMPPVSVDTAEAEHIVSVARALTVHPLTDFNCGLDGTTIRLAIEQGFNKAQFEWWCDLPNQWEPFRTLFAAMENLMRKAYPNYDLRLNPEDK